MSLSHTVWKSKRNLARCVVLFEKKKMKEV